MKIICENYAVTTSFVNAVVRVISVTASRLALSVAILHTPMEGNGWLVS